MGKYGPLEKFLRDRRPGRWRASFREVEALLGFKLPPSALKYPAWWSNDETGHSHAKAWLDAGWRTEDVDIADRKLTFARVGAQAAGGDPWGCMTGTVAIMPGVDLTEPSEGWSAEAGRIAGE
jgi:hypothetical protein